MALRECVDCNELFKEDAMVVSSTVSHRLRRQAIDNIDFISFSEYDYAENVYQCRCCWEKMRRVYLNEDSK
jgi:hypothetical protein